MSIHKNAGALLLGTRLKRLSDKFLCDLSKIYRNRDIRFEAGWFPVFYLLDTQEKVTISCLSKQLEITHSGASQMVATLKKKGFIQLNQIQEDKRMKTVCLTPKGREKLDEIKPIWTAIQESLEDIIPPGEDQPRVLQLLGELESAMAHLNFVDLVENKLAENHSMEEVRIGPYGEDQDEALKALVLNWLSESPESMPEDMDWLNHPQGVLKEKRSALFTAGQGKSLIGACAVTQREKSAELTLIFHKKQTSEAIFQALLDNAYQALRIQGIKKVETRVEVGHLGLLKILQTHGFKLMGIEKTMTQKSNCARLSKDLSPARFKKG
ncbi:MAG: MarR family winged helix-turn-helix transcriptional regulator [Desulfovibrionales bacterium]|nr:MarR family winged helix-turn-helix transcriptional regulator [Desulfovibrionales bacterium]